MKLRFKDRLHKHKNDCWCDSVALATHVDYDNVYNALLPFIEDEGAMIDSFSEGLLYKADYTRYAMTKDDPHTVRESLQYLNHHDNELVMFTKDHMFYVHKGVIHDIVEVEERNRYLDADLTKYFMRPLKETKHDHRSKT